MSAIYRTMFHLDSWFTLRFSWRLWRGQRLQWCLMALGLGCFCALLLLLLQLGPQLRAPQPAWAEPEGKVATVHRTDPRGRYRPISNAELYRLTQLPEVGSLGVVQFSGSDVRIAEQNIERTPLVYYSENLPTLLGLQAPFLEHQPGQQQPVFISHWLWLSIGKPAVDGLELMVRSSGKRYSVAAVLPAMLDRFSDQRPGIWLPWQDRFLPLLNRDEGHDLTKGPGPKALAMTENLPHSFGFIQLKSSADLPQLARNYDALPVEWQGLQAYTMLEEQHQAELIAGIELFPEQRNELWQQFWLLSCLTVLCGAVVAINLVFCLIGQLVQRQHEIGMRQVLGARTGQLSRQLAGEQLPLWGASIFSGGLLYWQGADLLASLQLYQQYFGHHGLPFDWVYAGAALLGLTLFLLLCSQLPLLWFLRGAQLFRNRQGQRNRLQQRLAAGQLVMQLSFAGIALLIASSLQFQLFQQENAIKPWQHLEELRLRFQPGVKPDAAMQRGELALFTSEQVAFSGAFTSPDERQITMSEQGNTVEQFVGTLEISSNYLQFLQATPLAGSIMTDHDGVVINQALADLLLEPNQSYLDLPGRPLTYLAPMQVQVQIRGVVANLPHRGVASKPMPMLYTQLKPSPWYGHRSLTVTMAPALVDNFSDALADWADRQGQDLDIAYGGTLASQLIHLNEPYWMFARISLLLAAMISLLAGLSLYYQLRAQLLSEQSVWATHLAVGASVSGIVARLCGHQLVLLLASIPVCAMLLWFLTPWLSVKLGAAVFAQIAIIPTVSLLLLLVLLATVLPALQMLRRPISLLLQGRVS